MPALALPAPSKPMTLDEVVETWPVVRQSWLASFDDCALSSYFRLKYAAGSWGGVEAAMGTIFHRVAAACLADMRANDSETIPIDVALAILEEKLEQRDVEPEERVRIPLRKVPTLRWVTLKFARDNSFSIRHIVDLERRLEAELTYRDDEGAIRPRTLSGQLDVLVADPEDPEGAIVVDFKSGWGIPPQRKDPDADEALSYHGPFQLRFYAWLIFKNYPSVKRVKLREFYVRRTVARLASVSRDDLPEIEEGLARSVLELDRCLASGKPKKLKFPAVAPWNPSPGKHCSVCVAAHRCPIESDAREKYAVTSPARAKRAVAELEVADAVRESRRAGLRPYIEENGPQPSKWSRGRRVLGLQTQKGGKPVLKFFTPEGTDRAPQRAPEDRNLEDALRKSAEDARGSRQNGDKGSAGTPAPEAENAA